MPSPLLSFRVEKKLSEVSRVNNGVEAFWHEHHLPDNSMLDVLLSIEEVLSNIIRHSLADFDNCVIVVSARIAAGEIQIQLEDNGPAFNPLSYSPPKLEAPLEDREAGGLGIHLVKCLMDRVRYERREERNFLTMAKTVGGTCA